MKKKLFMLLALVMAFALCLALAACNGDKTQNKLESGNIVAEGDFAEGVTLSTNKLEATDDNYKAAITKIADKDYDKEKVAVFNISLVKDNAKVQPSGKVKITMPAPFTTENGYVTYHIKGETVEELATTLSNGKISFETTSFSYFVVAGTTGGSVIGPGGLTPNDPTKNFFAYADKFEQGALTANGTEVPRGGYSATLKEGDTVELIASANDGYQMLGWYKNEKASGSDEKYNEMSNPATFTYSGTEKMFVYARFDVITYEITVNLNGGEFKSGESIPETYNVETATITLPTPQKSTMEFLGWVDADGNPVTEIAKGSTGNVTLTAQWNSRTTKVNTIKNRSYAIYNDATAKDEEIVLEGKNMVIGVDDIPFGADSVHCFQIFKNSQAYFQDMTYGIGNLGGFNYEVVMELVVAEGDRNVTVGRFHTSYHGASVRINGTGEWIVLHIDYEGKMEDTDCVIDSVWFDLLPNVDGYTDAKGKWIYQGDPLDVYTDAKRVPKVRAVGFSPMGLEGYNGYQHGGTYDKFEFENAADSNGVCKFDKWITHYYIMKSKTEDRKYDLIVSGDVEIYIANKETRQIEKLLISKKNEKHLVTIASPKDTTESWYTDLLFIAKPGGKVVVYNGISPEGSASYAAADTALTNAVTFACPSQSKKERFMCE